MRGVGYGVDAEESARDGVDGLGNGFDVVYRSEDVRGLRAGYEFCLRGQEGLEDVDVEFGVLFIFCGPPL